MGSSAGSNYTIRPTGSEFFLHLIRKVHSIIEAMSNREQFSESIEMYLETILILSKDGKEVRQADIARALDFSRPTVHIAIKKNGC